MNRTRWGMALWRGTCVSATSSLSARHPQLTTKVMTTFISPLTRTSMSAVCATSSLCTQRRFHGNGGDRSKPIALHFTLPDGSQRDVTGYEGQTLLDVCAENGLPMEGACGGSCACSTCHVYLDDEAAMATFDEPTETENDMIDQAFFPQPNSRLGCQLHLVQSKHDGLRITMPKATRNMYVDGATVTPH